VRAFWIVLLLFVVGAVCAAPVPQALPYEVMTEFETLADFHRATVDRASRFLSRDTLSQGFRDHTPEGWYATYSHPAGVMLLSTIPDGRLRYGLFSPDDGRRTAYQGKFAPHACVGCHNKVRPR
jgi:hypothetical protein